MFFVDDIEYVEDVNLIKGNQEAFHWSKLLILVFDLLQDWDQMKDEEIISTDSFLERYMVSQKNYLRKMVIEGHCTLKGVIAVYLKGRFLGHPVYSILTSSIFKLNTYKNERQVKV